MNDFLDFENGRDFDKIIDQLSKLKYKRITRTIQFFKEDKFEFITELVIYNQSMKKCFIVPGEIYKKEILLDFEVISPKETIQVSSDIGDMYNLQYLISCFNKCLTKYRKKFLEQNDIPGKDIEDSYDKILKKFTEGNKSNEILKKKLFKAFWKEEGLTVHSLIDDEFGELKNKLLEYNEIKKYYDFIIKMEDYFIQFLYVKDGIEPYGYTNIKIKTIKDAVVDKIRLNRFLEEIKEYNISIEVEKPYPLEGTNTLLFKLSIPEQEKFYYTKKKFLKNNKIKSFSIIERNKKNKLGEINLMFDLKYFSIVHGRGRTFCENLKHSGNLLEISKDLKDKYKPENEDLLVKDKKKEKKYSKYLNNSYLKNLFGADKSDTRLNFGNNNISLYFRKSRTLREINGNLGKYCDVKSEHIIKFNRTLKSNLIWIYLMFFLILFSLYSFFLTFNLSFYIQVFVGLIITTSFHYINMSKLEKSYLKIPFIIFLLSNICLYVFFQFLHLFLIDC